MQNNKQNIMISNEEKQGILDLMHQQIVPAIGCTEPVCVALCVAKAKELLGELPEKIELRLSANILKNAMGVGIPGTGMIGLPIAISLGALIGRSELLLEVLRDCNEEAVERGREYIKEDRIDIKLEENDPDKLYVNVICSAHGKQGEARIKTTHTNFVFLRQNDEILLDKKNACAASGGGENMSKKLGLTLKKVYEFATTTDLEDLRFILEAKRLNENASNVGSQGVYGHNLGKTISSKFGVGLLGDSIFTRVVSATTNACDARMAGAMVPVMSNSGSGNQGICTTMPVVAFAKEKNCSEEQLIRALTLSNLTAIYIKQHLGALSALCGCVVASTGSSCGITYLMGGNYEQVSFAVKNMIGNICGMLCDGAKPSCAMKLTTGVSTAMLSAMLAMQNEHVTSVEGIVENDVDRCICNLAAIGSRGMDETDKLVLNIMTHKEN